MFFYTKSENRGRLIGLLPWCLILITAALFEGCISDDSSGTNGGSGSSKCTNTYGTNTVTDCRDGQIYKTVVIGSQTWMAQNLNYADSSAMPNLAGNSWCYNNSTDSCAKYGRLYKWAAAMNLDSSFHKILASAEISFPQQGACPSAWHIPTDDEWTTLENYVGGSDSAGIYLRSTSGWNDGGNGTDTYGFSALPAGELDYEDNKFISAGHYARFWCATDDEAYYACERNTAYFYPNMWTNHYDKDYAYSVRCVKDSE
ncbi:MAG: fibrobacter succinogenes major paralogous domain-containing protein [Sphaerochaetaceae bacterium]